MKVYLANSSEQKIGGGWSWIANFRKGMGESITSYEEADTYLIPSPSMVQRDEVLKAKEDGKKIVLRIDNAVRNSRNRNTGMSRMKDFATWADLIVYQSTWAMNYLTPFLGNKDKSTVILNGVDTDLFRPGVKQPNTYMYSRFNRDETKNWEVARYTFSQVALENPEAKLWIIGQFSPELVEGNFDFYNEERFKFWGVQPPEFVADLYGQAEYFMYTYFNDACSNSLIEALVSGCKVGDRYGMLRTGGAGEIMHLFNRHGAEYFGIERMCNAYKAVL